MSISKSIPCVTRLVSRTLAAVSLCGTAVLVANACSSSSDATVIGVGETGRLQLNLTGVSATNQVYRLRNAAFTITGRSTGLLTEVSTEAQPEGPSLLVELPADTYDVFLQPGYYLELLQEGLPVSLRRQQARSRRPIRPGLRQALAVDGGAPVPAPPPAPPSPLPGSGLVVDAELISSNPGVVTITTNAVSPLNFIFRVGGSSVETGTGVLDIGLEVFDEEVGCINDGVEPNEDLSQATPIVPGAQVAATLCTDDVDTYVFPSPVPVGEAFVATVSFQNALGDIDVVLGDAATGDVIAFGGGIGDQEVLVVGSDGGDYFLQAFLPFGAAERGNRYTVDIGPFENTAENSCCEASPLPGCEDDVVMQCVCEFDSFCCQVAFDEACVATALGVCGASCVAGEAESDCCTTSDAPGCTDPIVNSCVCDIDFQCCVSGFDEVCVAQAVAECGAQCALPPAESDCCNASAAPGCTVSEVQECVCDIDPFCCSGAFDENCAGLAQGACGAACLF